MVTEFEVRGRYAAYTQELEQLDREIDLLQLRIRMGSEHWREDSERLAGRAERRRALAAQRAALDWVLTPGGGEDLAEPPRS